MAEFSSSGRLQQRPQQPVPSIAPPDYMLYRCNDGRHGLAACNIHPQLVLEAAEEVAAAAITWEVGRTKGPNVALSDRS